MLAFSAGNHDHVTAVARLGHASRHSDTTCLTDNDPRSRGL